jgi:hypothetical protein
MKDGNSDVVSFITNLRNAVKTTREKIVYRTQEGLAADLSDVQVHNNTLWLTFSDGETTQELTIPIPQKDSSGNLIIEKGHVKRSCGTWMIEGEEKSFWQVMLWITTQRVEKYFNTFSKRIFLERLLRSFSYKAAPLVFKNFQRIVDDIINRLPLVGTSMQSWAMCNRVQILDPAWDNFTPKEALAYQRKLNKDFFPWTSLGQSDSGMCNNTLLKIDVRETIPFGLSHHNPRRNLYQTLGMKGDEEPSVMSVTESKLADNGIVRKGWNLMTAFVDMPLNFEDQIIVSDRLKDLFVTEKRSFTCHGLLLADEGDDISFLYPLSIEPDGSVVRFNIHSDSAVVSSIKDEEINFNGTKTNVKVVTVEYKRLFKDGLKITNRHGNKGIIIMSKDTGVVHDPVRGEVPIDIIVSAKSVQKRKNFGQLLEALTTLIHGTEEKTVIEDDYVAHTDVVKEALVRKGYKKDGTMKVSTGWGDFKAVAGWVHWGCIKTPEDQIWTRHDTLSTNNKDLRTAGNKVSHIEMRALVTIFGKKNAIIEEIMQHWQGYESVFESLKILNTMRGHFPELPVVDWSDITSVDQSNGFFHELAELSNSVADETKHEKGFYIKLPQEFKYTIDGEVEEFLPAGEVVDKPGMITLDKIMVPPSFMRRPWKHQSGKYGLSDASALINNIIVSIYKFKSGIGKEEQIGRNIYLYLHGIADMLSSKSGSISSYCMAIRYPHTVKGTAAVGEGLAPNEIEIHESMARDLKVHDGSFVLVERFPCLGFMSLRVQRVKVTSDPNAKYVIRVSGNSLASQALDFDGDVLYLMSFHTPAAKEALAKEFNNPNPERVKAYKKASDKNVPCFREIDLDEYNIEIFPSITAEQNGDIVEGLTGIKRGTGTIIALCYNLMRILENNVGYNDENTSVALEILLDKVANSVFSMKHAGRSLESECREAICTADVEKMVTLGFDPQASVVLAETIKSLAKQIGFSPDHLKEYFHRAEKEGRSSIVNIIARTFHKIWFTSRSKLHPTVILENLNAPPADLSSWLFVYSRTKWEEKYAQQQLHRKGNTV